MVKLLTWLLQMFAFTAKSSFCQVCEISEIKLVENNLGEALKKCSNPTCSYEKNLGKINIEDY